MTSARGRRGADSAADSGQEYTSDPQYPGGQEYGSPGQHRQSGQGQPTGATATYAQPAGNQRSEQAARYAEEARYAEQDRWAGARAGTMLAGVLMVVSGLFAFLVGLTGIIRARYYALNPDYTYHWTARGWGITEVVLGAVIVCAGVCLLLGLMWARIVAIVVAAFNAISAFMFLPWFPLSSIVIVALNLFIIWAIAHYHPPREVV